MINSKGMGLQVPCGKCIACRVSRTREWAVRMINELESWDKSSFITLTYRPEDLPSDNGLHKRDLQLFWKRLRKSIPNKEIKYYACGEYGDKFGRPHYHAVLYGLSSSRKDKALVKAAWNLGIVYSGSVTPQSARYVAQYIQKKLSGQMADDIYRGREAPFQLQSQGIGLKYALNHKNQIKKNLYIKMNGKPAGLPRYYRKKLDIKTEDLMGKAIQAKELADAFIRERTLSAVSDPSNLVDAVYFVDVDKSVKTGGYTKSEFYFAQKNQIKLNYEHRFALTNTKL